MLRRRRRVLKAQSLTLSNTTLALLMMITSLPSALTGYLYIYRYLIVRMPYVNFPLLVYMLHTSHM